MATPATEEILCKVLSALFNLNLHQLKEISGRLNFPPPEDGVETKIQWVAHVKDHLTKSKEVTEAADKGLAYYHQVMALCTELNQNSPLKKIEEELQKKIDDLQLQLETTTKNAWRKEFRITGQIGQPGQVGKLTFTSLARQIEAALVDKRKETEIVEAVLKAISPELALRGYLEGKSNLKLTELRSILRAHYLEKDATALYHMLTEAAQRSSETPQEFLVRLMDLRQKVIFASQEDQELKYETALVHRMFLRSFKTGLQSLQVKQRMEAVVEKGLISDEQLFDNLNRAVADEKEAKQKRNAAKNAVKVNEVGVGDEKKSTPVMTAEDLKGGILKEIKEEVQSMLRAEVKAAFASGAPSSALQSQRPRRRGCKQCQDEGEGDSCRHCYKCGGSNHFARGCRATPGNDNRALRGDRK